MRSSRPSVLGLLSLFLVIIPTIIISSIREDYSHLRQSFSELGMLHAPYFIVFNILVFILGGLALIAMIVQLHQVFPIGNRQKTWLILAGLGWMITGFVPLSYNNHTLYILHITPAVIAYVTGGLGLIDWGFQLINTKGFEIHGFYTVVLGFLTWMFILVGQPTISAELAQLLSIASFYCWVAAISYASYLQGH